MQEAVHGAARRRLALVAFAALWLTACGGGGGGSDASVAAPTAGGSGVSAAAGDPLASGFPGGASAPVPGAAPAAPAAFSAFAPVRVAQSVGTPVPQVARLASGSLVAWAAGGQVWAQRTDAGGQLVGNAVAVSPVNAEGDPGFSIAADAGGGFIVTWDVSDRRPGTQFEAVRAVQVRRYAADGTLRNDVRLNDGPYHSLTGRPIVKATPDGGWVVAWTAKQVLPAPSWGFLQRLAPDGSRVGPLVTVGGGTPEVTQLTPVPLADGTVLAAWLQHDFAAEGATYSVYTQRFDAGSAPVTNPVRANLPASATSFPIDAAALAGGNVALAWIVDRGAGGYQVQSTLLTGAGAIAAPVETFEQPSSGWELRSVAVTPLADGFGVAWQALYGYNRGMLGELWMQRHAGSGAVSEAPAKLVNQGIASFSPTTGASSTASPGFSLDGGADGHFVGAFQSMPNTAYLMGQ